MCSFSLIVCLLFVVCSSLSLSLLLGPCSPSSFLSPPSFPPHSCCCPVLLVHACPFRNVLLDRVVVFFVCMLHGTHNSQF
ncbi:MAG: hypothetical protein J3R72DRAFT_444274 [Linnemannia gamsii]|nr:MAG: hypothetical protein J3R72DRAFT_444274 [Linnemannia gamsii]